MIWTACTLCSPFDANRLGKEGASICRKVGIEVHTMPMVSSSVDHFTTPAWCQAELWPFPKETRKRNGMIVITMTIPTISLSLRNLGSTLLHLQRANTEHWGDAQGLGPGYLELKYLLHRERYHSCAKNYAYSGTCPCKRVEFNTRPIHFAANSCPEMVNRLTWKYID